MPPVRDEESETQRKAHAKRVRETRRSTQGVTLDEIKSAEQLIRKKNEPNNNNNNEQVNLHICPIFKIGILSQAVGLLMYRLGIIYETKALALRRFGLGPLN